MNAVRRQFFLSYAVIGSVMPLMSIFLRQEAGFGFLQIGFAIALMNVPMLCSPVLITLLADRNIDPRRILGAAFTCSATVLSLMFLSDSVAWTLFLFVFHGLAFVAMLPLQDGYYFSLAEEARRAGKPVLDYPLVRVWGTVGFIVPSLVLFFPLSQGAPASAILPCAVVFCLLSLANSFTLPPVQRIATGSGRLPTREALAAIFAPNARWLCLGLFFAFLAATCYYAFVGNYLDEVVGIPKRYIALIINFGVLLEIGFTVLMPRMQRVFHLKGIMVAGLFFMTTRMLLLAFFPDARVAVAVQIFHGMEVLAIFVGPVMFLNRLAQDEFRNSIQGVYTMAVAGVARVVGGLAAGLVVSTFGLTVGLYYGAALAGCAFLVIAFLFSRIPPQEEEVGEIAVSSSGAS